MTSTSLERGIARKKAGVLYPFDLALAVQIAYNTWIQAYEEYLQGRLKNTRHRLYHLAQINRLFGEYMKWERLYQKSEAA